MLGSRGGGKNSWVPEATLSAMKSATIGVGFIGTGRISDLHALEYRQNPRARIMALCDRNIALAQQRANDWGVPDAHITDDIDDLLARNDVDLVEILLPHSLHFRTTLKAINAGKNVSSQKPISLSLSEADYLVAAAKASNRQFRVFENFIFHPPVIKAKQLIAEGAIGTPLSIRIKSNLGWSTTAWDIPSGTTAWRQNTTQSGGGPLVFDDGHHKFALAWHFMGNPSEVHAFIGRTEGQGGEILDAQSIVSFRFPGNRIGNLEVVYSPDLEIMTQHYAQDDRVEVTGTKGVLWINCGHGRLGDQPPLVCYHDAKLSTFHDLATNWEESFVLSTRHFLNVLTSGGVPVLAASDARKVLQFALAAQQSAATSQVVAFD